MASKKNKNNPDNKSTKPKTKLYESSHCESNCKDVGTCEKYKGYMERLKSGKVGRGIPCSK